jgi:hypothetical protein
MGGGNCACDVAVAELFVIFVVKAFLPQGLLTQLQVSAAR